MSSTKLRVAFIHPDLGIGVIGLAIGGAERLVVDAALGLQRLGHSVDIFTSHHDPSHCFEETRDGSLRVHHIKPPFPRSLNGKLHILFAHLRQLHLTAHLLRTTATSSYDVFFVDQLSTCIPFLRTFAKRRVVFYCHFPDKLLADGELIVGKDGVTKKRASFLKRIYRWPMDWLEETTTGQADIILANSKFTASVFASHFSIPRTPQVVYPGINISAYQSPSTNNRDQDADIQQVKSTRPTLLSLNRFEKKKNAALAVEAFALLLHKRRDDGTRASSSPQKDLRLVIAGGYDPRVTDNIETLDHLLKLCDTHNLTYTTIIPTSSKKPIPLPHSTTASSLDTSDVIFLLNFTTSQRSSLLTSPSTQVLLYTPSNEHFGIGPIEGMICGLPIVACNSGGPTETVVASPVSERTGWLLPPIAEDWARTLDNTVLRLPEGERRRLALRAKARARDYFGLDAMAVGLEKALIEAVKMRTVTESVWPAVLWKFGGVFLLLVACLLSRLLL